MSATTSVRIEPAPSVRGSIDPPVDPIAVLAAIHAALAVGGSHRIREAGYLVNQLERFAPRLERDGADLLISDGDTPVSLSTSDELILQQLRAGAQGDEVELSATPLARRLAWFLRSLGWFTRIADGRVHLRGPSSPSDERLDIAPLGDPGFAALFVVAAAVASESFVSIGAVDVTADRLALFELLEAMGARVTTLQRHPDHGLVGARLEIATSPLTRGALMPDLVPSDPCEHALLALVSHFCRGESRLPAPRGWKQNEATAYAELLERGLRAVGIGVEARRGALFVRGSGSRCAGGTLHCEGSEWLALVGIVAGLLSRTGVTIPDAPADAPRIAGALAFADALRVS